MVPCLAFAFDFIAETLNRGAGRRRHCKTIPIAFKWLLIGKVNKVQSADTSTCIILNWRTLFVDMFTQNQFTIIEVNVCLYS